MQKIKTFLLLLSLATFAAACTTVPPGYVGIVVNNYGTNRGVDSLPVRTGRVTYNPFSEDVYKFPTFLQNRTWTKNPNEGSSADESITFNSVEGAQVNVDIGLSVAFEADKVPAIFIEQRQEPDHIIDVYIRNRVRDAFSTVASSMRVQDIYGAGKETMLRQVKLQLDTTIGKRGYHVDNISIIGKMRLDQSVENSINAALAATQKAIQAENTVKQIQAEAEQNIAKARGDSASAVIEAAGQAVANDRLSRSITSQLIQYNAMKKWDGVLPQFTGNGGIPLINIPNKQ